MAIASFSISSDSVPVNSGGRCPDLDVISVVEVTEHVQENTGVEAQKEVDTFGVFAVGEHNTEVMVKDDTELDL